MNILETALKYTNNSEYKLFIRFEADPNSGSEVIESMNRVVVGLVSPMFDVKSETSAEAEE